MSPEVTLGAYLRRCREMSGRSVEAVAAGSRIVPRLVRALEEDRHDVLPAPVYVRGFVRAYCAEVGASVDEALALYEAHVPVRPVAVPDPALAPSRSPSRRPLLVAVALGLAGVVIAGAILAVRAAWAPGLGERSPRGRPAPPVGQAPITQTAIATSATTEPADHVLVLRAIDTTWVRVVPENGAPSEATLAPGTVREWRSSGRFRITLGNAGGVELELDGRAIPGLGERGRVVRDVVIPDGLAR